MDIECVCSCVCVCGAQICVCVCVCVCVCESGCEWMDGGSVCVCVCVCKDPVMPSKDPVADERSEEIGRPPEDSEDADGSRSPSRSFPPSSTHSLARSLVLTPLSLHSFSQRRCLIWGCICQCVCVCVYV